MVGMIGIFFNVFLRFPWVINAPPQHKKGNWPAVLVLFFLTTYIPYFNIALMSTIDIYYPRKVFVMLIWLMVCLVAWLLNICSLFNTIDSILHYGNSKKFHKKWNFDFFLAIVSPLNLFGVYYFLNYFGKLICITS